MIYNYLLMLYQKNKKSTPRHFLPQVDSFIVDLRRKHEIKPEINSHPVARQIFKDNKAKSFFSINLHKENKKSFFSFFFAFFSNLKDAVRDNVKKNKQSYFFKPQRLLDSHFIKKERYFFSKIVNSRKFNHHRFSKKSAREELASANQLVSFYRSFFAFIFSLIIIILPFKILAYFKILDFSSLQASVVDHSLSAFNNLAAASEGAASLNLGEAASNFSKAENNFNEAREQLGKIDDWILSFASFSGDPKIKLAASGKKFLDAGIAASSMGKHLSEAGNIFLQSDDNKNWGSLIDSFVEHGREALIDSNALQTKLNAIDVDSLPEAYRDKFLSFRKQSAAANNALSSLLDSAQEIKDFLGVSRDKRYLLVFQNNAEMRGSGGFFGSYALVDIRDGRIRRLEVPAGGSYDTEAGMRNFIQSPKPLWLVSPRWYFWDANWWPDWPTSARSLMWFYEKSGGPTVDGVISFTPDVLADLLKITGPIDLQAEYGLTVDADNFWDLIQATVEKENLIKTHPEEVASLPDSPKNQPKKIIGDLMAKIMDRLPQILSLDNLGPLLQALEKNLSSKNIMLYFSDPDLEKKASRYGFDGAMLDSRQDYLLIAHTNIAGQKSDRKMSDKIEHSVQVLEDLSLIDTLTITRTHTGVKNEILSGVRNVDWLRVYVPQGSQLLEASGFKSPDIAYFEEPDHSWEKFALIEKTEGLALTDLVSGTKVYTENNKTVFANWVMIDPGETAIIKLRYRLPFKLKAEQLSAKSDWLEKISGMFGENPQERFVFSLLFQKQPGAKPAEINFNLQLPYDFQQVWNYPNIGTWNSVDTTEKDLIKAVLMEK